MSAVGEIVITVVVGLPIVLFFLNRIHFAIKNFGNRTSRRLWDVTH